MLLTQPYKTCDGLRPQVVLQVNIIAEQLLRSSEYLCPCIRWEISGCIFCIVAEAHFAAYTLSGKILNTARSNLQLCSRYVLCCIAIAAYENVMDSGLKWCCR